jgi:hypothetical protein
MKFTAQEKEKNAFLQEGDECFSLVGSDIFKEPYVCYYDNVKLGNLPFALTRKGVQVPVPTKENRKATKFVTYEELVTLVSAGVCCDHDCDCVPDEVSNE